MIPVTIDATAIPYHRGVSRYTHNLITALVESGNADLTIFCAGGPRHIQQLKNSIKDLPVTTQFSILPLKIHEWLWKHGFNAPDSNQKQPHVFHSWDWIQPPVNTAKLVSTIHDLAILKFPETAHPNILKHHQASWEALKKHQAEIIAVSEATKQDCIELLDIPSDSITVIPEALPQALQQVAQQLTVNTKQNIIKKLEIQKPFILFVGTTEPRKNLKRLIQAWQPLAKDLDLIIAGEVGWDSLETVIDPQHSPKFLGKVSDATLCILYENAQVFAFPSLYEGFGLPILESYFFETPVITSNISSMPEVAGKAGVLVDPLEIDTIRTGITTLLNESKSEQEKRRTNMQLQLRQFTWKKTAQETLQVYQKVLQ